MWALVVSSILLAPVAAVGVGSSELRASSVVAVLILEILGTGVARALAATLAGRVGAPRMATTTYLVPIVVGVTFRDEGRRAGGAHRRRQVGRVRSSAIRAAADG